jgi:membrane peptidoglycan carboxypeptidase
VGQPARPGGPPGRLDHHPAVRAQRRPDARAPLARKLDEVAIAVKLDATTSKDEILERYLDTVYFGRGAYGIETAAQTFFAVPAKDLTAEQGAVLAALLRSPTAYDPEGDPERARDRWRYVVDGMVEQGWLDGPADRYAYPEVRPAGLRTDSLGGTNGYLVAQALEEVVAREVVTQERLERGGLVVTTTVERRVQDAAVAAVRGTTGETLPDGVFRALARSSPAPGRIRAVYAGDDYVSRPFNAATQGTAQAGSSFKPYVLATALRKGISLDTRFDGASPQLFGDYRVRNAGGGSYGVARPRRRHRAVGEHGLRAAGQAGRAEARWPRWPQLGHHRRHVGRGLAGQPSAWRTAVTRSTRPTPCTLAAGGCGATPFLVEQVADRDATCCTRPSADRARAGARTSPPTSPSRCRPSSPAAPARGRAVARTPVRQDRHDQREHRAWFVGYTPQLATAVAVFSERRTCRCAGCSGCARSAAGRSRRGRGRASRPPRSRAHRRRLPARGRASAGRRSGRRAR